ncbi:MAG: glutamine-synthetase adenylyltransferase, partial [Betaproteobacteria bacterium HGW-Betaproteobacteria-18]
MTRPSLASHSRFAQRVRRRYEAELPLLASGVPGPTQLQTTFEALQAQGQNMASALRITRQLVVERLLCLDCDQQLPLAQVTQAMTDLAEFALNHALTQAQAELDQTHGAPMTAQGQRAQVWIVGMGKLGARELNVSSDIDLIYVYDEDGETAGNAQGRNRVSNHEYFGKVVRAVYALVGDTTEHGFVFRVDLALRPNGNSGLLVTSFTAYANYQQQRGSNTAWTWEHQAMTR